MKVLVYFLRKITYDLIKRMALNVFDPIFCCDVFTVGTAFREKLHDLGPAGKSRRLKCLRLQLDEQDQPWPTVNRTCEAPESWRYVHLISSVI